MQVDHHAIASSDHLAVVGDLGFGDADLALEIANGELPIERFGFNVELHLLIGRQHPLALNVDVIKADAGIGQSLLS